MKKFFVLFCIPAAAIDDWVKNVDAATREQQSNEMMQDWQRWMQEHEGSIIDKGLPIGKTMRVTAEGTIDARNDINWYLVMQGESQDAVAQTLENHPHLRIPTAYIDVSDASRPGM